MVKLKTTALAAAALLMTGDIASTATAIVQTPLNVRAGEGPGYPIVAVMPEGIAVDAQGCGNGWCYIPEFGGYASASYLAFGDDAGPREGYAAAPDDFATAPPVVVPYFGGYYDDDYDGDYSDN